jgi:hypothetical protein
MTQMRLGVLQEAAQQATAAGAAVQLYPDFLSDLVYVSPAGPSPWFISLSAGSGSCPLPPPAHFLRGKLAKGREIVSKMMDRRDFLSHTRCAVRERSWAEKSSPNSPITHCTFANHRSQVIFPSHAWHDFNQAFSFGPLVIYLCPSKSANKIANQLNTKIWLIRGVMYQEMKAVLGRRRICLNGTIY